MRIPPRLVKHRLPRAAWYLARGKCPKCKRKSGLKRLLHLALCGECGKVFDIEALEARIMAVRA